VTIWEVKLVPCVKPNAGGRWTHVSATTLKFGQVIGDEFIVKYREEQPYYQHGGYSRPEYIIE
jgi:hypothetical protein